VKRHEERNKVDREAPKGHTLFITHLDNFVTEAQLSRCFSNAFGAVERVELKSTEKHLPSAELRADHAKGHVTFARIVFKDSAGLEKALAAATGRIVGTAVLPLPKSEFKEQLRLGKYLYRDAATLRREVDEWMLKYDQREEQKKREARENLLDDDGFMKVVSGLTRTSDGLVIHSAARPGLKTGVFSEPIRGVKEVAAQDPRPDGSRRKKKKRQGQKEQVDFYRFQMREKRREEIADWRKQKVEAEEKVERMRKAKKFKTSGQGK